jgi:hypothetical protein
MKPVPILLLADDSGEGPLGDMIDPVLRRAWENAGFGVAATYFSDLQREHLDHAAVVVLLRTSMPGHPLDDPARFLEKSDWLRTFVERGGGLLILFTECYGKTEGTLNTFTAPWGLRFYFNRLRFDRPELVERFPRFFEGVMLPAMVVDNPVFHRRGTLALITEGGHGTQHLTCEGDARWFPILRGAPHIRSEPFHGAYAHSSPLEIADPVLAAGAEIAAGRVMAFPGSAPFWIVNPHIWRFDGAQLKQRGGAGAQFLTDALSWLAGTARNRALPETSHARLLASVDPARLIKPELFSFHKVGDEAQRGLATASSRSVWFGPHPRTDLAAWAAGMTECAVLFPLVDYAELDKATWPEFLRSGENASSGTRAVIPGYNLLDDEGVLSAVVSPEVMPAHELRYPNTTLLEHVFIPIGDCLSILRTPLHNRIPAQRYGGYNLIEWEPGEAWLELYRQLVASKYFIAPVAIGQQAVETRVVVPPGSSPFEQMRRNRHASYVTEGPRLDVFTWQGPGLTDDDWEGYWYGYRPGDEATVVIRIVADAPIEEVILYDGADVLETFASGETSFTVCLRLTLWRDRALHLTARDAHGRRLLATYPLYTRNLEFWGHVGSDQMNNYVNALAPSARGFLGVRGELYDMFGFVTLGAGWGDYLRITPSIRYSDFMPRQEISLVIGSFNVHHPSALVGAPGSWRYLNDHRRVFAYCGADAQWFRSRIAGEHVDNDEGREETWHGKTVRPTRQHRPVAGTDCTDEYIVWRWQPGEVIHVEVRKHFRLDPACLAGGWLTFASNTHHVLPGLSVRSGESARLVSNLPTASANAAPHKDWDNSHYLREGAADTGSILPAAESGQVIIGHGGVGTFFMMPLGTPRAYRCLLHRTDHEVQVYFQCHLAPEECSSGGFTVSYLAALDSSESYEDSFNALARHIDLNGHAFSSVLDLNGVLSPAIDLDEVFPALRGHALWLEVRGLPGGLIEWRDESGLVCFCSQPMDGRSFHRLAADAPRRYRLVPSMELRVEATP